MIILFMESHLLSSHIKSVIFFSWPSISSRATPFFFLIWICRFSYFWPCKWSQMAHRTFTMRKFSQIIFRFLLFDSPFLIARGKIPPKNIWSVAGSQALVTLVIILLPHIFHGKNPRHSQQCILFSHLLFLVQLLYKKRDILLKCFKSHFLLWSVAYSCTKKKPRKYFLRSLFPKKISRKFFISSDFSHFLSLSDLCECVYFFSSVSCFTYYFLFLSSSWLTILNVVFFLF